MGGDDRPARYVEEVEGGSRVIYRASSLGHCPTMLGLLRDGVTPMPAPGFMQEKFAEGHLLEPVVVGMIDMNVDTSDGVAVKDRDGNQYAIRWDHSYDQDEVEYEVLDGILVRGHTDGAGYVSAIGPTVGLVGEGAVIEIKCFGEAYWKKFQREGLAGFPDYQWQLSVYMLDSGRPALFVVGRKSTDGARIEELLVEWIEAPPVSRTKIMKKLYDIENNPTPDGCAVRKFPCGMFHVPGTACSGDKSDDGEGESKAQLPALEAPTLVGLRANVKFREDQAKAAYEGIARERKLLDEQLHQQLIARGVTAATEGETKVEWVTEHRKEYVVKATTREYLKVTPPRKGKV